MHWDIISRKLLNGDTILRDEEGILALEHKMKAIIENLAADEELSAECYDDYITFDSEINRDYYCFEVSGESEKNIIIDCPQNRIWSISM